MAVEIVGAGHWQSDNLFNEGYQNLEGTLSEKEANFIYDKDPRSVAKFSYYLNGRKRYGVIRFSYVNPETEALYRLNLIYQNRNYLSPEELRVYLQEIEKLLSHRKADKFNSQTKLKLMLIAEFLADSTQGDSFKRVKHIFESDRWEEIIKD